MEETLTYIPSGDAAFILKAGDKISITVNQVIRKLLVRIEEEKIPGITELIPSYNELMIIYDPCITGYRDLLARLHSLEHDAEAATLPESETIEVPVLYGGESGPDLAEVAETNRLSEEEVIRIHSSGHYLVYMLGFTPGFCYLGGMDERIATPRKASPRLKIPAGAVGIAGNQTGIYPIESPGGWQLIGRTPLRLFDPQQQPEFLFKPGDLIRFCPVDSETYDRITEEVSRGVYVLKKQKNQGEWHQ
jgi:inhibitor of KinA